MAAIRDGYAQKPANLKAVPARRHKFGAVRTVVDGREFPSKAEASRYMHLRLLMMQGTVSKLELQPRFDLIVNGVNCGFAAMDFRYETFKGETVVEDVKGRDNPLSVLKRKLVKALYGVDVVLVSGKGGVIVPKKKGRKRVNAPAQMST